MRILTGLMGLVLVVGLVAGCCSMKRKDRAAGGSCCSDKAK